VTTREAAAAAENCAPYLRDGRMYVDLNSTGPGVKRELDRIVRRRGGHFVEGAILGAVGVTGAATLWEDVSDLMSRKPFERLAENWLRSHAVACDRRYAEMVQVAATMREIDLAPVMAAATETFFDRSRALGLAGAKPDSIDDVVEFIERRLRRMNPEAAFE
jgi:hypothetical protein